VRFLTIIVVAAALLAACGGSSPAKPTPVPPQGPFPPPEGENADVVQFLRDYYLTFEDVYSGRTPPAKLIQMYTLHCTENLKPGALDVLVVSMSVNRPGANATKITQIDVVTPTVTGVPERPDLLQVSLPGERDLGFLIDGRWRSGEEYESLIKSKVQLSTEPVTRELIRIDGKLYISDCDFGRGLPGRR
jgi:hypothetical protein